MSTPNYTVSMVAYPLLPGEPAPVGMCLVKVGTTYQPSTLANRGTLKSSGIVTSAGAVNGGVFMQSFGDIPAAISGLGAGIACYVRVGDTALLERRDSPVNSDDIVGWTEEDGTVHLFFGGVYNTTGGGGSGNAVQIQGVPVDPGPSLGDTLVFTGAEWSNQPGGGGGDATSIQGTPVDPTTPDEGQSLVCSGGSWVPGIPVSNAVQIQGRSVSNAAPNVNDALIYDGFGWVPAPGGGGGSGDATSIQTNPVSPGVISAVKSVYIWNGSALVARPLTQSDIGPDFSVSLSGGVTREVGQAASGLTFTASYTGGTPTSATLTNNNGDAPFVVPNPYTSASPPWSITKTANNALVVVTITAQPGSVSDTVNLSWQPKIYYGAAPDPGVYNAAWAHTLSSQPLRPSNSITVNYSAGVGDYCWFVSPASYGTATGIWNGFPFGAAIVGTFIDTNSFGVSQLYNVVRSNLSGLGTVNGVAWS